MLQLGQIDRSDDRPVYRQIADMLKEAILSHRLAPGARLPSEADLIEHFGVARMTVRQAIQELRRERYVFSEHGRGVFVQSSSPQYEEGGADIQAGVTTFVGRSHTEIARLIARNNHWRMDGDRIVDLEGMVVTETIEELARKALALGWFDPSGAGINWHHFSGTKHTNADTIRQAKA